MLQVTSGTLPIFITIQNIRPRETQGAVSFTLCRLLNTHHLSSYIYFLLSPLFFFFFAYSIYYTGTTASFLLLHLNTINKTTYYLKSTLKFLFLLFTFISLVYILYIARLMYYAYTDNRIIFYAQLSVYHFFINTKVYTCINKRSYTTYSNELFSYLTQCPCLLLLSKWYDLIFFFFPFFLFKLLFFFFILFLRSSNLPICPSWESTTLTQTNLSIFLFVFFTTVLYYYYFFFSSFFSVSD